MDLKTVSDRAQEMLSRGEEVQSAAFQGAKTLNVGQMITIKTFIVISRKDIYWKEKFKASYHARN